MTCPLTTVDWELLALVAMEWIERHWCQSLWCLSWTKTRMMGLCDYVLVQVGLRDHFELLVVVTMYARYQLSWAIGFRIYWRAFGSYHPLNDIHIISFSLLLFNFAKPSTQLFSGFWVNYLENLINWIKQLYPVEPINSLVPLLIL